MLAGDMAVGRQIHIGPLGIARPPDGDAVDVKLEYAFDAFIGQCDAHRHDARNNDEDYTAWKGKGKD